MPEHLTVFIKAVDLRDRARTTRSSGRAVSDFLDYEGELGFVIGRRCRHVQRARTPRR